MNEPLVIALSISLAFNVALALLWHLTRKQKNEYRDRAAKLEAGILFSSRTK